MKGCDVNKDIKVDDVVQITLPDVQIPLFDKAVRGYVKPIENKAFFRTELSLAPNESL